MTGSNVAPTDLTSILTPATRTIAKNKSALKCMASSISAERVMQFKLGGTNRNLHGSVSL